MRAWTSRSPPATDPPLDEPTDDLRGLGTAGGPFPPTLPVSGVGESLATTAEEALGPLDILVNNAGAEVASSFTGHSPEELDAILALEQLAPLVLTHQLLPGMLARSQVENICSLASKRPRPYGVPHAAPKCNFGRSGPTPQATKSRRIQQVRNTYSAPVAPDARGR